MNLSKYIYGLISLLIGVAVTFPASATDYMPNIITVSNGLPQSTINAILRDSKGFLWIGTNYGLARYNNSRMKLFYHDNNESGSITHNQIENIFEDHKGRIWIMAFRGLSVFDPATEKFTAIEFNGKPINGRGYLLLGDDIIIGAKQTLLRISGEDLSVEEIKTTETADDYFYEMLPWSPGCFVCSVRKDGIWVFKPSLGVLERLSFMPYKQHINSLAVDSERNLWITVFGKGVECYSEDGRKIAHFDTTNGLADNVVLDLHDTPEYILVAHELGIDAIDKKTMTISPSGLSACGEFTGTVKRIYTDQFGNIYAGSVGNGIVMLQNVTMRTFRLNPTHTLECPVTSFFARNNNDMYCGVDGTGIVIFDNITDTLTHIPATKGHKIISLDALDSRHLLVSDYLNGLFVLDRQTGSLSPAPSPLDRIKKSIGSRPVGIHSIEMSPGVLAILSDSIYFYNHATKSIKTSVRDKNITSRSKIYPFYADSDRVFCFGENNIYYVNRHDRIQKLICSAPEEILIRAAQFNGRDTIYWATSDTLYTHRLGESQSKAMDLGDMIRNIKMLYLDGNKLWIGANNRLFLLKDGRPIIFETGDGVIPNEFLPTAVYSYGPYLYFGGNAGFVRVNRSETDSLAINRNVKIQFSLAGLYVNNESVMSTVRNHKATVPNDAIIRIEVIDRDSNPSRTKLFRFYLEGTNISEPFETTERMISMNDLPPGRTVKVSVSCSLPDGSWSAPTHIITLYVEQVWWNSWWFRCIIVILIALVVLNIIRIMRRRRQTASNQHRRRLLEHDVQILANINESLRSPLNKLYQPLVDATVALEDIDHPSTAEIIDNVNSAIDMVETMREIVNSPFGMLHSKNLTVSSTTLTARFNVWLSELFDHYVKAHRIERHLEIIFNPDFDPGIITFDASRIEMVITCILSDLFDKEHNKAYISVESDDIIESVIIDFKRADEIVTDGKLSPTTNIENLRIIYARWLAEASGSTMNTWFNEDDQLIRVTLDIPLSKNGSGTDDTVTDGSISDMSDCRILADKMIAFIGIDSQLSHSLSNRHSNFFGSMKFIPLSYDINSITNALDKIQPAVIVVDESENVRAANLLCRKIRTTSALETTPIILITDPKQETSGEKEFVNDEDVNLAKPFDLNVFIRICQQLATDTSAESDDEDPTDQNDFQ